MAGRVTTIFLIRHGEIAIPNGVALYGGSLDLPLNRDGREQIAKLAVQLTTRGVHIDEVYTSHLRRSFDSGRILAQGVGIPLSHTHIDRRLGDNLIPKLAGLSAAELERIKEELGEGDDIEFSEKLEGHETKRQILERMKEAFRDILSKNEGKTVAIVGHGDPLRFLLFWLTQPDKQEIPPVRRLLDSDYLEKGEAMRIHLDSSGRLIEKELVVPREGRVGKEIEI